MLRWLGVCAAALLVAATGVRAWAAQGDALAAEYQVKAAFLYKFAGYVEWPPQAFPRTDSPLVIGVLGADMLAETLERAVAGRTINGHSISVRRLRRGDPYAGIHVLFMGRTENAHATEILASPRDSRSCR
ncbi:MAG: YfiR family protein [Rhodospirillales bacterium]